MVGIYAEQARLCWESCRLLEEDSWLSFFCTLSRDHPGDHYDVTFSRGWRRDR